MNHEETRALIDRRREQAKDIARGIPNLSVEEWATVHVLADGSAFVDAILLVGGDDALGTRP